MRDWFRDRPQDPYARNNVAAFEAAHGDYDRALSLLPAVAEAGSDARLKEVLEHNHPRIAHLRQRRYFVDGFDTIDPIVDLMARYHVSVYRVPDDEATVFRNEIELRLGSLQLHIPFFAAWSPTERSESFIGDVRLDLLGYLSSAIDSPDTRLAFGVTINFGTGPDKFGLGDGWIAPLVAVGHLFGRLALTSSLAVGWLHDASEDADGAMVLYDVSASYLLDSQFAPVVSVLGKTIVGASASGETTLSFRPGGRLVLGTLEELEMGLAALIEVTTVSGLYAYGVTGDIGWRF